MISAAELKQKREKIRKLLLSKKKSQKQLEDMINELVHAINESVIQAHELELSNTLSYEELEDLEKLHQSTMIVAIQVFEQYLRLMAVKGMISNPAEGIPPDEIENIYYAYVSDHFNHRVENDLEKVEKELSQRYPLTRANPADMIKRLVHAGRRLDPKLDLPEDLENLQNTLYGGRKKVDVPSYIFGSLGDFPWGVSSFINVHCRKTMEDTHFIGEFPVIFSNEEPLVVHMFAIFDGHGGGKCSKFLSEALPSYLKAYLENIKSINDLNIYNAIKLAFVEAHERFLDLDERSGATASVALVINDDLWIANIGDTRVVMSSDGKSIQLTEDQKPEIENINQGIYKRGGKVVGGRIEIQFGSLGPGRAVGDKTFKGVSPRPKLTKVPLKEVTGNSWLIIACDGLWDVIGSARAVSLIKDDTTPEQVVKTLLNEAINLWTSDNVTVMAVKL